MSDRATPSLPSRDLAATSRFYSQFGFRETFHDAGWLILERGGIQLEFFPRVSLDPCVNRSSCCIRVSDGDALYRAFCAAGLSAGPRDIPRMTRAEDQPWGIREFAVVDPDGNLLRCLSPLTQEGGGQAIDAKGSADG